MSLIVNVYTRGDDGSMNFLDDRHVTKAAQTAQQAGFESCREKLWGSPAAISLGLSLLPMLAQGDLYAEGQDVEQLAQEIHRVLDNLPLLARETGYDESYIEARAQDILNAANHAGQINGCVVVW